MKHKRSVNMTTRNPAEGPRRLGVLGGSFDPPHLGHLGIAEEARESFALDRVLFVPAAQPPHKPTGTAAGASDRLAMVRLAVRGNPYFDVSDIELHRKGPSYTIDTLEELEGIYRGARLFFIVGADSLCELHKWHRAKELVSRFAFVIVKRPGAKAAYRAGLERAFGRAIAAKLEANFIKAGPYDISATEVRGRVSGGRSIRYLVAPAVERYIIRHGLYH